jgi:magnesium chelatase subunit D
MVYPFSGIVGQEEMKLGLILNVIDPSIGGVLMMGHRGTGKSTAVRALADLLPDIWIVRGCRFNCEPADSKYLCAECAVMLATNGKLERERSAVPVVDLPLGATEDRVCGAIDIQRALSEGIKAFEPGLLARSNRGFLYIDEVNLLEDHLVDLLLDVSITGRNKVERENISIEHPARFVLIGSGNPEEGELRPQLLDRFGLYIEIKTENDPNQRMDIVEKREGFERNPEGFCSRSENEQKQLRQKIARAGKNFPEVKVDRTLLRQIATLCSALKVDGHRGELTIMRAARALAAFEGRKSTREDDVRRVATMALRHRLHRDPLAETASSQRIEQALDKTFQSHEPASGFGDDGFHSPGNQSGSGESGSKNSVSRRSSNPPSDPNARNGSASDVEVPAPPAIDANLPGDLLDDHSRARTNAKVSLRGRQAGSSRRSYNYQRGRYARAVSLKSMGARVALLATLRAAVYSGRDFSADDLRYKQFARKNGTLFIFAIDASSSMALNRINQAKGALLRLLEQSYINRDSVAIVAFKGTDAEVLLPPSRSIVRARRVLDALTIGGGTPLSAGLACSVQLARRVRSQRTGEIVLLLFTDGRANVPLQAKGMNDRARHRLIEDELRRLGNEMRKARLDLVVVDTQNPFTQNGEALALAENLGARYFQIWSPHELRDYVEPP